MNWTNIQKIFFRFLFCYVLLYILSNQFITSDFIESFWKIVVPWFADTFMSLPEKITIFPNGSGDTTFNWVSLVCYLIVSLFATIIWSILDRNRNNYTTLMQWALALVRYYLIFQMIIYGFAKVFYLQFGPPSFSRLIQAYGDSSPMGILWTFMGQSKGYTVFAGLGELLGGILLMSRRTQTVGALVVFGVMANVMALNFFYDVPVKILSSHIVFFSLLLLLVDFRRLMNIFFLNQSTEGVSYPPYFKNEKWERIRIILKWIVVVGWVGYSGYQDMEARKIYGSTAPKPKNYGLYEVERFERNGDTIPPLTTDSTRWENFIIQYKGRARSYSMTNKRQFYNYEVDSLDQYILMRPMGDTLDMDTLYFTQLDSAHFKLNGILRGDTLNVSFLRKGKEDFLLRNRGFHWVSEYPYNR